MNILFIHSIDDIQSPTKPLWTAEQMQFGISYISSFLKEHGHNTKLLILSRIIGVKNKKLINKYLKNFTPQLICFTAVSTEYQFITHIAQYIKNQYPDIYLLIGGPHVSLNPEEILSDSYDAVCIGEGEYPVLELVSQLEDSIPPSRIPNLWIKHDSAIEKNEPRPVLQNLDVLPFPDRNMWLDWIGEEDKSRYPILLGRGCPFQCTYCCNHALRKLAKGPYVRFRSPENILLEIQEIATKFPTKRDIYLEIETIGADEKWALELCSKLEYFNSTLSKPFSYGVNLRITPHIDFEPLFAAFKKSNFKFINIGIESGSERIRREILNRKYSNQEIITVVTLARKYELKINFYNLIGIPGETLDDFKETVKINRICLPDKIYTHIFFPYPGTELHTLCKKRGLIKKALDTDLERCKAVLDLPGFSKKQIQKGFVWFDYYAYKGFKPMYKILSKVLVSRFRSNSFLHYFYRRLTFSLLFKKLKKLSNKFC